MLLKKKRFLLHSWKYVRYASDSRYGSYLKTVGEWSILAAVVSTYGLTRDYVATACEHAGITLREAAEGGLILGSIFGS